MGGGTEAQEGGDTYIIMTNSICMAETNTSLQSSYSPIKKQSYLKKRNIDSNRKYGNFTS